MTRRRLLPVGLSLIVITLVPREGLPQVQVEDRELKGQIGFTNSVLVLPDLSQGSIAARSIGLSSPFNDTGAVYGGTPLVRNQAVVVHAFDNGEYSLTSVLELGVQKYRFGYAANSFDAPGYPNFINDVYRPVRVSVTPASPDPITGVDLLECAGAARVHFIQSDGLGGFVAATHTVGGTMTAVPRLDPADLSAPFEYRSGTFDDPSGGVQAARSFASGSPDLFVRSSGQAGGPDVRYRMIVGWTFTCPEVTPTCPDSMPNSNGTAYFEGASGMFGTFGVGGAPGAPGDDPGVFFTCDEMQDFYVVVPPSCNPGPPCPPPSFGGTLKGCVNLIGEREIFSGVASLGGAFGPVHNSGESPAPFSSLFDHFDPNSAEGFYTTGVAAVPGQVGAHSQHILDLLQNGGQSILMSPVASVTGPSPFETVNGPDFCMVPGIYSGTITLRDASPGGVASGATQDLELLSSRLFAFGPGGGSASRDFRGNQYDPLAGRFVIPYENIFANPDQSVGDWSQPRMEHFFFNSSQDYAFYTTGASRIEFSQPTGALTFDPHAFISTAAGGTWTGALEFETQIATRAARTFPVNYDMCYGLLRVQINTRTALFFDPRISTYSGSGVDDAGTPLDASDDTIYGVFPQQVWSGTPQNIVDAANVGFVNMHLPKGLYTGIGGTIRTVLAGGQTGITQLPSFNLNPTLDCGDSCTAIPDAILCLSPLDRCNEPSIVNTGAVTILGTLNHTRPVIRGFYRIDDGPENPIDLQAAGVTCSPTPCADPFTVSVSGFGDCRNRIEIGFVDQADNPISAFLSTTLDTVSPVYHVHPSIDPAQPAYVCGTPVHFSPPASCDGVPRSQVPIPVPGDACSAIGNPDSPLIETSDAPDFFARGTTLIHLGAVDSCGNGKTCDVPVVIADTTAPHVDCGLTSGYTLFADGQCRMPATISATISDNCDPLGPLAVTNRILLPGGGTVDSTGSSLTFNFPLGDSTVTFTATDSAGNTASCSIPVHAIDLGPPTLNCPFTDTIGLNSPTPWTDGVSLFASHGPLNSPLTHLNWSGGTSPYRLIRVPMPARMGTDPHMATLGTVLLPNNPVFLYDDPTYFDGINYFYRVFQQEDGTKTVECQGPGGATLPVIGTVTDNCGIASVSNSRTGNTLDATGLYALGSTQIDYLATDTSLNTTQCASTVYVVDTTRPVIQCPAPLTITTTDPSGAPSSDPAIQAWLASANASDLCGPTTLSSDAPEVFPVTCSSASTATQVTITATDQVGLTATCTSTLTVILDEDSDGFACNEDCNDTRPDSHPGAIELCDGVDNNCDGTVDEGCGPGKVTGGGEITVPGGFANYGFIVQRKVAGGPVSGSLEYYNHARSLNIHSVDMLTLNVFGTTATFTGTCTKNHTIPCTFSVTVEDNGEPGFNVDRFTITVSGEPVEGDTGPIIHGNIQIHAH